MLRCYWFIYNVLHQTKVLLACILSSLNTSYITGTLTGNVWI